MEKEEVLEKYGDVELHFSSYYKYSFTFKGEAEDGTKIVASFGGHHSDIYRESVSADQVKTLNDDWWSSITVKRDGETLYEEFSY